jgi:hypothetical protein
MGCRPLTAAAGVPDIKEKFLQGCCAGGKSFKVHVDGCGQRNLFAGKGTAFRPVRACGTGGRRL